MYVATRPFEILTMLPKCKLCIITAGFISGFWPRGSKRGVMGYWEGKAV